MAPVRVLAGASLTRAVAGYAEITLPDIAPGQPARLVLKYADPGFRPANRAWLPLGGYLRVAGKVLALPRLPAGPQGEGAPRIAPAFTGLRLIPQPDHWQPAPGTLAAPALACAHPAFAAVDALARRLGLAPLLGADGVPVQLQDDASHGAEGYALHIADAVTLHRLLDLMALFKLNRFHWHFADDEGFRLQVACAPELWQNTETRGEGCAVPGVFGGGIRAGGSYSPADARALIDHGAALNIAILPEIEVPAHAFALNRALRGLRDPNDIGDERSVQGYPENIVNPALAATWALLMPLASEVAALFPLGMLHLGCDELPPGAWQGSPAVAALKAAEGLADSADVQGWMMARLAAYLAGQGVRAAWEEAAKGANGGIGHAALLFSWTGQGPGSRRRGAAIRW